MKKRILAIAVSLSIVFGALAQSSASAFDELYSKISKENYTSSGRIKYSESNALVDDYDIKIDDDTLILENNAIISKEMLNFVDSNNAIVSEYTINTNKDYEYFSVIFLGTDGVVLNSKSFRETLVDDFSITVSFTPCNPFFDKDTKSVYDYQEDTVIMSVSFWNNNEIQYTEVIDISILYTPYGTFLSDVDQILSKRSYTRYLLDNEIIDEVTYEDLNVAFHCFDEERVIETEFQLAEFDASLSINDRIESMSAISDECAIKDDVNVLTETPSKHNYVEVTYNIQALNDGDRLRVYGDVYWYDNAGNKFPAQYVNVDIMDQDILRDDLIATVQTSALGHFNCSFDNQKIEGGRDIYLKVYSGNDDTMVYDFGSFDFFASGILGPLVSYNVEPYYFTTAVVSDITTSKFGLKGCALEDSIISKSFSIANALYYARKYEKYINGGATLNNIAVKIHYPLPMKMNTSFTLPILDMGSVMLSEDDYADWGTIMHEYGHAVADKLEIFVGYLSLFSKHGFEHVARYNLTDYYEGNKGKALKISWNEGWASYYSLCAQKKYSLQSKGFPGTSDTSIWNYDIVNGTFYGEDNELAIAATMINLIVQNIFSERELWNIIKTERPQSFHDLNDIIVDELVDNYSSSTLWLDKLNKYGAILEKQNISAKTASTYMNYSFSSFGPNFSWIAPETFPNNPNGTEFIYEYQVALLSIDPLFVYISPQISNTSYTIPSGTWTNVIKNCTNGFYWTIITDEASDPASGGYYSKIYSVDYAPEQITMLTSYRYKEYKTTIDAGQCYDCKVTFKNGGNKLIQTFGTNDTVLELYSLDGTLLLGKKDTDDKGYGRNALLSYNFAANTEYIVRVKFYSSTISGSTKIAIIPTYSYETYEDIYSRVDYKWGLTWSFAQNNVKLMTYKYSTTQDLTMNVTSEVDTYLYIIDPRSAEPIQEASDTDLEAVKGFPSLYNDDYLDSTDSRITKTFEANVPYLVIVSAYNPSSTTSVGEFYLDFK